MIDTVFFDLGWTIVKPASGDWNFNPLFFEMYPQFTIADTRSERWQAAFRKAYQPFRDRPYMENVREQIQRWTAFYETFLEMMDIVYDTADAEKLAVDISTNDHNMLEIESASTTLKILKKQNFKLGIISDTWPNIVTQLSFLQLDSYFDFHTYSYECGTLKPSPMLYQDALIKSGSSPRNCIFIDDLGYSLEAGEKFGIRGIQSLANPNAKADERFPGIHKPIELLQLISD